jgi:hypothetical protein
MVRLSKTALTHYIRPITEVKEFEYIFYRDSSGQWYSYWVRNLWLNMAVVLVKGERTSFVTTNWCIPVKNSLDRVAVVFCSCEIIQIFSVVFCVVWAVCKFDSRLGSKNCCAVTEIYFVTIYRVFPDRPHNELASLYAFSCHCTAKQEVHVGAEFSLCVVSYRSSHSVSGPGCHRPRVQEKGIHIFEAC